MKLKVSRVYLYKRKSLVVSIIKETNEIFHKEGNHDA